MATKRRSRPGRGPGKRFQLTADQRREAVAVVEALLARGRYTHEIKEVFRRNWGRGAANLPLSPQAVTRLIKEAKANIRAHLGVPDEGTCQPSAPVDVVQGFTPTHWGTRVMTVRDPDGRLFRLEAGSETYHGSAS